MKVSQDYPKILMLLGLFQALEALLKVYIGLCYFAIEKKVQGALTFDYSYKDIENHPLERLAAIFKKLNSNEELCKKIARLIDHRNELAHKSMLLTSPSLSSDLKSYFLGASENHQIDYEFLQKELNFCINEILSEVSKVRSVAT